VTNFGSDSVTEIDASNGNVVGTYAVGVGPQAICFDGANIRVANYTSSTLSKL